MIKVSDGDKSMKILLNCIAISPTIIVMMSLFAKQPRVNTRNTVVSIPQPLLENCRSSNNCKKWKKLLDPKSRDFWKEGNHLPDEGWILFAQNMNLESAKLFLLRGELKAKSLHKAMALIDKAHMELIAEGIMEDRYNVFANKVEQINQRRASNIDKNSFKKLQYFFIYSSTCPHCKGLAKKLASFPNVYPLQANKAKLVNFDGLKKSEYASKETLAQYAPGKTVPVLVIHNPKTKEAVVLEGNKPSSEIILASARILQKKKG